MLDWISAAVGFAARLLGRKRVIHIGPIFVDCTIVITNGQEFASSEAYSRDTGTNPDEEGGDDEDEAEVEDEPI